MNKVIIIGCPGSGKSTFARGLRDKTGLPLYHLDMLYWNEDGTTVEKDVFLERLRSVLSEPSWIIDGNYLSTMEMRLKECDTVFFLDYPADICLKGIAERKGKSRSDMPCNTPEDEDGEFVSFVKNFALQTKPQIAELVSKYKSKKIISFTSREDAEIFLANQ